MKENQSILFGLLSFQDNGELLEDITQTPAFYALTYNDEIIDYYTTLEALQLALQQLIQVVEAEVVTEPGYDLAA